MIGSRTNEDLPLSLVVVLVVSLFAMLLQGPAARPVAADDPRTPTVVAEVGP